MKVGDLVRDVDGETHYLVISMSKSLFGFQVDCYEVGTNNKRRLPSYLLEVICK